MDEQKNIPIVQYQNYYHVRKNQYLKTKYSYTMLVLVTALKYTVDMFFLN